MMRKCFFTRFFLINIISLTYIYSIFLYYIIYIYFRFKYSM